VVLSKTHQPPPTRRVYKTTGLWVKTIGHLSFIVVVSFLFIPVCFTAFFFAYFGLLHGVAFVTVICVYNYLESKYHPLGETRRRWDAFINLVGMGHTHTHLLPFAFTAFSLMIFSSHSSFVLPLTSIRKIVGTFCCYEASSSCQAC
jgi:hypothetical protein